MRGKIAGILYADLNEELSERPDLPHLLFLSCHAAGSAIDVLPTRPKQPARPESTAAARPVPPPVKQEAPKEEPVAETPVETPAPVPAPVSAAVAEEEEIDDAEPTVVMQAAPRELLVPEEDRRLHDDAKRFARLLVSEIKLYNEAQVNAGREHKDLYERLKDDIERSRRMYAERVPDHIHSSTNYFYEELVRTLANGDPSLLGM